jgi:hypothetical protein
MPGGGGRVMDEQQQPEAAPDFLARYGIMQEIAFLTRECGLTYAEASAMPAEDRLLLVIANARLDGFVNGLLDWSKNHDAPKSAAILTLVRPPEAPEKEPSS